MSKKVNVSKITRCAVFCAIGALLPQAFHAIPNAGQTILPMHIPALLAGIFVGVAGGFITGLLSPLLSCLITGGAMPIVIKAPFMMFEIATYGVVCGLVWKLTKNIKGMNTAVRAVISVIAAQIAGRLVNALCTVIAVNLLGVTHPAVQVGALWTSVVMGVPGIIIQIVAVPAIVTVLSVILKKKA